MCIDMRRAHQKPCEQETRLTPVGGAPYSNSLNMVIIFFYIFLRLGFGLSSEDSWGDSVIDWRRLPALLFLTLPYLALIEFRDLQASL